MTEQGRRRWILVAALLGSALTASLGLWQLDRAAQKRALQQAIARQAERPALDNAALRGEAGEVHRAAQLQGQWVAERSVWLDNRPMDGRVGFIVVTPLRLSGRSDAILVQRGWAPRNAADRSALPPLSTPPGEQRIAGRLAAAPSRLFELGAGQGGPIRQNLDLAAFGAETGLRLVPLVLLQTDAAGDGLRRDWPAPTVDIHKHYGYAVQWFALAALILGLYVWFQHLLPRRRARRTVHDRS